MIDQTSSIGLLTIMLAVIFLELRVGASIEVCKERKGGVSYAG